MFGLTRLQLGLGLAIAGMLVVIYALTLGYHKGAETERRKAAPVIASLRTDLAQCQASTLKLRGALDAQNAAIQALSESSQAKVDRLEREVSRLTRDKRTLARDVARLEAKPKGATICERYEAMDKTVLETLR